MRICLLGPGNIEYHYFRLLKIGKKRFKEEIDRIASILSRKKVELVLLPAKGLPYEIAKKCKELNKESIIYGLVPFNDKVFGIKHLKDYMDKKVMYKFFNTGDWYKQHMTIALFGDVVLLLGLSLGSLSELLDGLYIYKILAGKKPYVGVKREKIHKEVRAGSKMPLFILAYRPFIKKGLGYEIESYIKKSDAKLIYVDSSDQFDQIISKLVKKYETF